MKKVLIVLMMLSDLGCSNRLTSEQASEVIAKNIGIEKDVLTLITSHYGFNVASCLSWTGKDYLIPLMQEGLVEEKKEEETDKWGIPESCHITTKLTDKGEEFVLTKNDKLVSQVVLEAVETGKYMEKDFHNKLLDDYYKVYSEGNDTKADQYVKLSDKKFLEITGMRLLAGDKEVIAEFNWKYTNITPFGKRWKDKIGGEEWKDRKIREDDVHKASALFALYYDGWRLMKCEF